MEEKLRRVGALIRDARGTADPVKKREILDLVDRILLTLPLCRGVVL